MSYSFWNASLLDPRKRSLMQAFRTPDDALAYEDGAPPVKRSRALDERIADYFNALQEGDASGRTRAMNAIIDVNRADHTISGVPVHAHEPLPDDFAKRIVEPLAKLAASHRSSALKSILEDAGPDRRPVVGNQLNEKLLAATTPTGMMREAEDLDSGKESESDLFSSAKTVAGSAAFREAPKSAKTQLLSQRTSRHRRSSRTSALLSHIAATHLRVE